jgi:hypothetical protein
VPRRRGRKDIEAAPAVSPLLERRILDLNVAEGGEPLASEAAMPAPGSTAVTGHPSAASERVA